MSQACSDCSGKGANARCARCNGTRCYSCTSCTGSGRTVSEWFKSLDRLPVDRLRFEFEKRQREVASAERQIGSTQTKIARVSRELDEMYEWYERDRIERPGAYNAAGTEPAGLHDFPREISNLECEVGGFERTIENLQDELSAIQEVIDLKWTRGAHT